MYNASLTPGSKGIEKGDKRRFVEVVLLYNPRLVYRGNDPYGDWRNVLLLGDLRR